MTKLGYRDFTVIWATAFFSACVAWILFGPETGGRYATKIDGELTFRGWAALVCGAGVLLFALPHLFHVLTRRPAVEVADGRLCIGMLPYESIPLSNISRIRVGDGSVDILLHDGRRRRLNARILYQPRAFFFGELKDYLPATVVVEEK